MSNCLITQNSYDKKSFLNAVLKNVSRKETHVKAALILRNRMLIDPSFLNNKGTVEKIYSNGKVNKEVLLNALVKILYSKEETGNPDFYLKNKKAKLQDQQKYGAKTSDVTKWDVVLNHFVPNVEHHELLEDLYNALEPHAALIQEYVDNYPGNLTIVNEFGPGDMTSNYSDTFGTDSNYRATKDLIANAINEAYIIGLHDTVTGLYKWMSIEESIEHAKMVIKNNSSNLFKDIQTTTEITDDQIAKLHMYRNALVYFDLLVSEILGTKIKAKNQDEDINYNEEERANLQSEIESMDQYDVDLRTSQMISLFLNIVKNTKKNSFISHLVVREKLKIMLDSVFGDPDNKWLEQMENSRKMEGWGSTSDAGYIVNTIRALNDIATSDDIKKYDSVENKAVEIKEEGFPKLNNYKNIVYTFDGKILVYPKGVTINKNLNTKYQIELAHGEALLELDGKKPTKDMVFSILEKVGEHVHQVNADHKYKTKPALYIVIEHLKYKRRMSMLVDNIISTYGSLRERKFQGVEITQEFNDYKIKSFDKSARGIDEALYTNLINRFTSVFENMSIEDINKIIKNLDKATSTFEKMIVFLKAIDYGKIDKEQMRKIKEYEDYIKENPKRTLEVKNRIAELENNVFENFDFNSIEQGVDTSGMITKKTVEQGFIDLSNLTTFEAIKKKMNGKETDEEGESSEVSIPYQKALESVLQSFFLGLAEALSTDISGHKASYNRSDNVKINTITPSTYGESIANFVNKLTKGFKKNSLSWKNPMFDFMETPVYLNNIFNPFGDTKKEILSRIIEWDATIYKQLVGSDRVVSYKDELASDKYVRTIVNAFVQLSDVSNKTTSYLQFLPPAGKRDRAMMVRVNMLKKEDQIHALNTMQQSFIEGTKMKLTSKNFKPFDAIDFDDYPQALVNLYGKETLAKNGIEIKGISIKIADGKKDDCYKFLEENKYQISEAIINNRLSEQKRLIKELWRNQVKLVDLPKAFEILVNHSVITPAERDDALKRITYNEMKDGKLYKKNGQVITKTQFKIEETWDELITRIKEETGEELTMDEAKAKGYQRRYAPQFKTYEEYEQYLLPLISFYDINNVINSFSLDQLFAGDSRFFKNSVTKTKRRESIFSPGTLLSTRSIKSSFNIGYIDSIPIETINDSATYKWKAEPGKSWDTQDVPDTFIKFKETYELVHGEAVTNEQKRYLSNLYNEFIDSQIVKTIETLLKDNLGLINTNAKEPYQQSEADIVKALIEVYGDKFEPFDGQGIMLPEWRDSMSVAIGPEYKLNRIVKSIHTGHAKVEGEQTFVITKYSSFVLDDGVIGLDENGKAKHPILLGLRELMRKGGFDELALNSAAKAYSPEFEVVKKDNKKLGKKNNVPSYDAIKQDLVKRNSEDLENIVKHIRKIEMPTSGIRMQFNPDITVEEGHMKDIANPTQLTHYSKPGQNNVENSKFLFAAAGNLYKTYMDWFMKEYGTKDQKQIDHKKIAKYAIREIENSIESRASWVLKALVSARVINPLNYPGITDKVVNTVASMFSKEVVSIKFKGAKMIQQSSLGLSTVLKTYRKNDTDVAQCLIPKGMLPKEFEDMIENGKELPYEAQSYLFAFRIPSTEIHSSILIMPVGFHNHDSNLIIVPDTVVPRTGADFDVDSLFIIKFQELRDKYNKNKIEELKSLEYNNKTFLETYPNSDILLPIGFKEPLVFDDNFVEKVEALYEDKKVSRSEYRYLIESYYKNQMVFAFQKQVGTADNFARANKPINTGAYDNTLDSINELVAGREPSIFANNMNINNIVDSVNMQLAIKVGAVITGAGARAVGALNYLLKTGANGLNPRFKGAIYKFVTKSGKTILSDRLKDDSEKTTGLTTLDYLDAIINLAIDNMKELKLPQLNVNSMTMNSVVGMFGLGGSEAVPLAIKMLRTPALMELSMYSGSNIDGMPPGYTIVKQKLSTIFNLEEEYDITPFDELNEEEVEHVLRNYTLISDLNPDNFEHRKLAALQYKFLNHYNHYFKAGSEISNHSNLIALIKAYPIYSYQIDELVNTYHNLFEKNALFDIPNFFTVNPHLKEVYSNFMLMADTVNKIVYRDNVSLKSMMDNTAFMNNPFDNNKVKTEKRNQFLKFLMSAGKYEILKDKSTDEFMDEFAKKMAYVKSVLDSENAFIKNVTITPKVVIKGKPKKNLVNFNTSKMKDDQYYSWLLNEFEKMNFEVISQNGTYELVESNENITNFQREIMTYAIITGDRYTYNTLERYVHPKVKAEYYKRVEPVMQQFFDNPELLDKVKTLFELFYIQNNTPSYRRKIADNLKILPGFHNGVWADAFFTKESEKPLPNLIVTGKSLEKNIYILSAEQEGKGLYQILSYNTDPVWYELPSFVLEKGYNLSDYFNSAVPHIKVTKENKDSMLLQAGKKYNMNVTYSYENDIARLNSKMVEFNEDYTSYKESDIEIKSKEYVNEEGGDVVSIARLPKTESNVDIIIDIFGLTTTFTKELAYESIPIELQNKIPKERWLSFSEAKRLNIINCL